MIASKLLDEYTDLRRLEFVETDECGAYDLRLHLASNRDPRRTLRLTLLDVSQLSLSGFGGGLTQLLCIRVLTVDDGLDRIRFRVEDLERQSLRAACRDVIAEEEGTPETSGSETSGSGLKDKG